MERTVRSLARWCLKHRFVVLGAWLLLAVLATFAASATGSRYSTSSKLTGTPSAKAQNLLQQAAPSRAGDTETIVFESKTGPVTAPPVQANINQMLAQVRQLPGVVGITSPYTPTGAHQISANGRIAFATVDFAKSDNKINSSEANQFVKLARAPNSTTLQVDVVGSVAASTNPSSQSGTFFGVGTALIVLLLVFGFSVAAILPLIGTGIALFAGLAVVNVLSNSLSMAGFTSQLCILIGLGVGVDYSLFILTRTRSGLRRGLSVEAAVTTAVATAGRAVLFAGITVCIALLGMVTVGVGVLSGAAVAASVAVLFPMAAALTLLPAFISLLGTRVLTRRQRGALVRGEIRIDEASSGWAAWARRVQAHRVGFALAALGIIATVGAPFFSMRQGTADYSVDPTSSSTTTYRGFQLLSTGFGPGFTGPLTLVTPINIPADQTNFTNALSAAEHAPGVVTGVGPAFFPAGPGHPAVAIGELYPVGSPQAKSTSTLITYLRDSVIPQALQGGHTQVLVGGQTALANDFASQLSSKLPIFVGMVVLLSFILLMIVFRSLLIPLTAAVMNLLSAAAAFGVVVAVFQWGWLDQLVGVHRTGPVTPLVPILMFAVLFGLSMDYEVFLVSRMHEEWLRTGDNAKAVNRGQAISGRTITAAAAIMTVVFASFILTTDRTIKMIGLGMAAAILLDALVIRTALVPAVMHSFGKANWRLPSALDRRLPRLQLEDGDPSPIEDQLTQLVGAGEPAR
jgi:putative drug exporter of the RND superfamily